MVPPYLLKPIFPLSRKTVTSHRKRFQKLLAIPIKRQSLHKIYIGFNDLEMTHSHHLPRNVKLLHQFLRHAPVFVKQPGENTQNVVTCFEEKEVYKSDFAEDIACISCCGCKVVTNFSNVPRLGYPTLIKHQLIPVDVILIFGKRLLGQPEELANNSGLLVYEHLQHLVDPRLHRTILTLCLIYRPISSSALNLRQM
jgi:hypothetical protein